jgi:hypothetical protein
MSDHASAGQVQAKRLAAYQVVLAITIKNLRIKFRNFQTYLFSFGSRSCFISRSGPSRPPLAGPSSTRAYLAC